MFQITILSLLALAAAATAESQDACNAEPIGAFRTCACPPGTDFQTSATYGMLGVNALDFQRYTSSFYDVAWLGITNVTQNGPDKTVGSTRTFDSPTTEGTYTFIEELFDFETAPDGSYIQRFTQLSAPIEFTAGNGSFSGYWVTLDAEYAAEYETAIKWSVYACLTGHPINFGPFRVNVLNELLATMKKAGLVKGNTTGPYSVQSF